MLTDHTIKFNKLLTPFSFLSDQQKLLLFPLWNRGEIQESAVRLENPSDRAV